MAAAGPFVSFYDQCIPPAAVFSAVDRGIDPVSLVSGADCGSSLNALTYNVDGSGAVNVQIDGSYRGIGAFGFSIDGPRDGVAISNLTPGYTLSPDTDIRGTFGTFQYFIYGGTGTYDGRDLTFTLTRDGGFLSPLDVFLANEHGWISGMTVSDAFGVGRYEFASTVEPVEAAPVPEPASMVLLGSGVLAAWRARKPRRR
jgi:hypothetical protein